MVTKNMNLTAGRFKDEIQQMRKADKTIDQISKSLGINKSTVGYALQEYGDPRPKSPAEKMREDEDGVRKKVIDGWSQLRICDFYGVSKKTLIAFLCQIGMHGAGTPKKHVVDRIQKMRELRWQGKSLKEISAALGVSVSLVSHHIGDERVKTTVPDMAVKRATRQLTPGKRYGDYTFLEMVRGVRTLYKFRHKCGWTETFIEPQLKEAMMA